MNKSIDGTVTRRTVLHAFGACAASVLVRPSAAAAQTPVIRTLLGDLEPAALNGSVLFHEHLSMRYPLGATEHFTDDVALMTEEARAAKRDGIACLVDGGHADMGRNLAALTRIASDSGLPVVASGGFYMQRWYPASLAAQSVEEVADALASEARAQRHGAFGEIGQQGGEMTPDEAKSFAPSRWHRSVRDCRSSRTPPTSGRGRAPTRSRATPRFANSIYSSQPARRRLTWQLATSAA